jgi:hypothetical protein
MKRILKDFLLVGFVIIMMMFIWSSMASRNLAVMMIVLLFLTMLGFNVYFLLKRTTNHPLERILYTLSFYIFSTLVIAGLLIDDHGVLAGLNYILFGMLLFGILSLMLIKLPWSNRFSIANQNFIIWGVSALIIITNLIMNI